MKDIYHYETPCCLLEIIASSSQLLTVSSGKNPAKLKKDENPVIQETIKQITEYFEKKRQSFRLPLSFAGYTSFQVQVWKSLLTIPYGTTRSYRDIATDIGNPPAVRAVGNACGKNPFLIIVPCHRVIRTDGSIGGFSADKSLKTVFLDLEKKCTVRHY